jgi:hypothetical protein
MGSRRDNIAVQCLGTARRWRKMYGANSSEVEVELQVEPQLFRVQVSVERSFENYSPNNLCFNEQCTEYLNFLNVIRIFQIQ